MINFNQTALVEIRTSIGEDENGNPEWATVQTEISCLIGWGSTGMEFGIERNVQSTQATLYCDTATVIPDGSSIIINGEKYRLDGEPLDWQAPQGFKIIPGKVVPIVKVLG